MPVIVESIAALREALADRGTVALIPTMGALHDGHLEHVKRAKTIADTIVVSIFVNPLQFGPNEDYVRYPRDLEGDAAKLADADFIFAPGREEMYPNGTTETKITAGHVGNLFEGKSRPGHYDGVLTVVAKLINIVQPSFVTFGQKDAQQIFLVTRMIADLNLPVKVITVDTVRDDDGLAMSSRNRFLDAKERRASLALSRALEAAQSSADRGIDSVLAASQSVIMGEPLVELDYLAVVNPKTFLPVDDSYRGPATVIVAARVGNTRLIDTDRLRLGGN